MNIKSTRPVSASAVKDALSARKEEGVELGYEQAQALEYAETLSLADTKTVEKLTKEIKEITKISDEMVVRVIDARQKSVATLKAIMSKEKVDATEDELKAIVNAIAKRE